MMSKVVPTLDPTQVVAAISLFGVIFSAALSAFISLASSRKSTYISSVTTERIKWIAEVRDTIFQLQKTHANMTFSRVCDQSYIKSKDYISSMEEILRCEVKLDMYLKGRGEIEDNVASLATSVSVATSKFMENIDSEIMLIKVSSYLTLLNLHCNSFFAQEFEKIKMEASGYLRSFYLANKARKFKRDYHIFCQSEGFFIPEPPSPLYNFRADAPPCPFFRRPVAEVPITHPSSAPQ